MFLIGDTEAITVCPTATWNLTATVVAGTTQTYASSAERLGRPRDVFIDSSGAIYVSDTSYYRVQKWLPGASNGTTVAGGSVGSGLNQLGNLGGVSLDTSSNVYVADSGNHRVMKWTPGASTGMVVAGGNGMGSGINQLNSPSGIFVNPTSTAIWIADSNNHRIVKWPLPSGSITTYGNGPGSGISQFYYPLGVFVDTSASDTLYVADSDNHRIQKWLPGAISGVTVAGQTGVFGNGLNQLYRPNAVVVDTNGYIYIADTNNYRVMRWAPGSSYGLPIAGDVLIGSTWLSTSASYLHGLNLDSSGALYITDYYLNAILKYSVSCPPLTSTSTTTTTPFTGTTVQPNTVCSTAVWSTTSTVVAGSPTSLGSSAGQLNSPWDVVIDDNGVIFVSDNTNKRVQMWLPGATSGTTIAGGGGVTGIGLNQIDGVVHGLSLDTNGNLYVADASRVMKWTPGAQIGSIVAGGNGVGSNNNQLNFPGSIFVHPATAAIWIVDSFNHRIVRWSSPTTSVVLVSNGQGTGANQFDYPSGLFVDTTASDTFYVADTNNHRIQKWLPSATSGVTVAGQTGVAGSASNQLYLPQGVLVDNNGNIYISDTQNSRIMRWSPGANYGVQIGTSPGSYTLYRPYGLRFARNGDLLVVDNWNSNVRKFSTTCPTTTTTTTTTTSRTTTTSTSTTQTTTTATTSTSRTTTTSTSTTQTTTTATTSTSTTSTSVTSLSTPRPSTATSIWVQSSLSWVYIMVTIISHLSTLFC